MIDALDIATWPPSVRAEVERVADLVPRESTYAGELPIEPEQDLDFRQNYGRLGWAALHFTRLLDEELAIVQRHGLRPLNSDLVLTRLHTAEQLGVLPRKTATHFRERHLGSQQNRSRRVCLALGFEAMDEAAGVWPLLSTWGGEAISFAARRDSREFASLRALGKPTVLVVSLDLAAHAVEDHVFPGLLCNLVGAFLGLSNGFGADIHFMGPVTPDAIAEVWQPGHPRYDAHDLPTK